MVTVWTISTTMAATERSVAEASIGEDSFALSFALTMAAGSSAWAGDASLVLVSAEKLSAAAAAAGRFSVTGRLSVTMRRATSIGSTTSTGNSTRV